MTDTLRPACPVHPGRILRRELEARGWTSIDVYRNAGNLFALDIADVLGGFGSIDRNFAEGLARAFGTSPDLWLGLQQEYDEAVAREEKP